MFCLALVCSKLQGRARQCVCITLHGLNTWRLGCSCSAAAADDGHVSLQEYIANKLQKQADRLGTEKAALLKEKSDLQRQARPSLLFALFALAESLAKPSSSSPFVQYVFVRPACMSVSAPWLPWFLFKGNSPVALHIVMQGAVCTIAGACTCLIEPLQTIFVCLSVLVMPGWPPWQVADLGAAVDRLNPRKRCSQDFYLHLIPCWHPGRWRTWARP